MKSNFALLIPGMIFGVGLGVSGMTNPAKVIGFLDLAGDWDPSLAFVMVGAILAFTILNRVVHRTKAPLLGGSLPGPKATGQVNGRLFLGAGMFGVGWAIGGFCPGPALANLSRLQPDILVFVLTMMVGMVLAQRVFGLDQ